MGIIQMNPDKSKHLETVAAKFGTLEVDFVNMRTESYATDSRIPQMEIGTPREDALRRDLTINALFYNIHTQKVEDFTNRGIRDLSLGVVRTPLPALVTLTDDPLRALRVVRFACRFQFRVAGEAADACSCSTGGF
jgi:tRNA nucleotidyltransferase (CCA-adding enzyme)